MILIDDYISSFSNSFPSLGKLMPWHITTQLPDFISAFIEKLDAAEYIIKNNTAIHHSAVIETGVVIKAPAIIHKDCFIGAHAYLRGGVILNSNVSIGPAVEIKSSILFDHSAIAHFNFVGDTLIGNNVNMEAGSVIANHHNDRTDKNIIVDINGKLMNTSVTKFGALVGDGSRIGANAVLSPGTILPPGSIIKRLELIQQT